jgi:phosphopantetheinyl transferase
MQATFPIGLHHHEEGRIVFGGDLLPLAPGEVHLWRVRVSEYAGRLLRLLDMLSVEERQYAHKFRNAQAREQFVVGRAILRSLLSVYSGTPLYQLRLERWPGGKLYLASAGREVCFNVSHSEGTAVLAFTRDREVGVDLEANAPVGATRMAERLMPEPEAQLIRRMPSSLARTRFTTLWSRMEACAKATGDGVSATLGLQRRKADRTPPWCHVAGINSDVTTPHVRSFRLGEQICSIASFGANWIVRPFVLLPERRNGSTDDGVLVCRVQPDHTLEQI